MNQKHILCYIEGNKAYFTSRELDEQWGDDWGDAPYADNAGPPYEDDPGQIRALYFEEGMTRLWTPDFLYPYRRLSVSEINKKSFPWLSYELGIKRHSLNAGVSYEEFISTLLSIGARIFEEKRCSDAGV